jgi:glucose/mannose transport system permease protein
MSRIDERTGATTRIRSRWATRIEAGRYVLLVALAGAFLLPVYVLVITAFKDPTQVSPSRMWDLPSSLSLDTFRKVWPVLETGFRNSLMLAIPASIISSLLGAANGFVLSKWRFPGSDFVFPLILFGMFIP